MLAPALCQHSVSISCMEIAVLVSDDAFSTPNGSGCVHHGSIHTMDVQVDLPLTCNLTSSLRR